MTTLDKHYTLANGVQIPKIGFGTWQIDDGEPAYNAVTSALNAGYRHIDTARAYRNETGVGRAIADVGIPRDQIFLTTKLPAAIKTHKETHESFADSLAALGTDYVDLYLIHWPWPLQEPGADYRAGNAEAWRAMEEIHHDGRARAIGVSNFSAEDIESLLSTATVVPQTNQIKFYVGHTQPDLTGYCNAHNILIEGYSPLATGSILDNPDIARIAAEYDKSVAQLSIRYVIQRGVLPLPKTTTPSRMTENADIDFTITESHMATLDALIDASTTDSPPTVS